MNIRGGNSTMRFATVHDGMKHDCYFTLSWLDLVQHILVHAREKIELINISSRVKSMVNTQLAYAPTHCSKTPTYKNSIQTQTGSARWQKHLLYLFFSSPHSKQNTNETRILDFLETKPRKTATRPTPDRTGQLRSSSDRTEDQAA